MKEIIKIGVCSILFTITCNSMDFDKKVEQIFEKHHLIKMVDYDLKTSKEQVGSAKSALFPTLSFKASYGNDKIRREIGKEGSYNPAKLSAEAKQLIWDFGLTSEKINYSRVVKTKEEVENKLQRQNLLLAAIESQLGLIKSNILLEYAKKSESNISEQTKLENTRLEMGKGYSTDVLQSKAQLLGAEANKIYAKGQMDLSEYRYKAVFLDETPNINSMMSFVVTQDILPKSLEEIETLIKERNLDVVAASHRAKVAKSEKDVVQREEYSPSIYADLSQSYLDEQDGVDGKKYEAKASVSFKWDFNLGMKASRNINAAKFAALSAHEKAEYVKVQAIEDGRRSWSNYAVAKKRTRYLENQVKIQKEFLRLARKERELGRRSLIDILNGETALLNAESEYIAAKIEESISAFRLLKSVGVLDLALFKTNKVIYLTQDKLLANYK